MIDQKLYSLIEVADKGSFSRAAESLSLSQPAVSKHISLLEEEYGVRLFDRNQSMRLTREGELVLRYAKRVLALENNLRQDLYDERMRVASLTVGVTHTAESSSIADTLASYASAQEEMTIKVVSGSVSSLQSMLKNYELDFAIIEGQINDPALTHLMLDTDSLVLVVAPDHPLARQNMVTISQVMGEKLILRSPQSSTRNLFSAALESKGMDIENFNVMLEMDNIATIKDLIRRGFGVSVLARSACMDELHKGKLVALPIENLSMIREINIVYTKNFEHPEIFSEIIRTYHTLSDRIL